MRNLNTNKQIKGHPSVERFVNWCARHGLKACLVSSILAYRAVSGVKNG